MAKSQMPAIESTPRSVMPSASPPSDAGAASRSTSPSRSSRTMFVWKSAMRTSARRTGAPASAAAERATAPSAAAAAPSAPSPANTCTTMSKSRPKSARSTAIGVPSR